MYDNIGKKIKSLAKWTFIVEAIAAIITGISLLVADEDLILAGLLTFFCGPIVAWVSSWLLYGFGEIIDKLCDIEFNTRSSARKSPVKTTQDRERINKLDKLLSQGLITEEEYQKALGWKEVL